MYSRFLSVFGLLVFVLFSSNLAYGQANTLKWYDFPNAIYGFHHVFNSRDAAGCPTGVGGTAVMPNHAATGEALCDQEAQRLWINKAYMRWYMSPVFGTWDSPGDNKLCRYQWGKMQIVNGTTWGGKWTNVVVCKYEPFDCGDRWSAPLQRSGLNWQLNWNRTKAPADYKRVGAHNFKCMPQTCTGAACPGVPANTRDECFLTDEPGEYRRLNGTLCACPASKQKVGNQCVADQCANVGGFQTTVPAGTTKSGVNCNCNNGANNPIACNTCPTGKTMISGQCVNQCTNGATNAPTCTTCPTGQTMVGGQCTTPTVVHCSDSIDNDADGLVDYPADPGCTSATDTSEENATCPAEVVSTYFWGMYGTGSPAVYNNPTTNAQSCPTGYVATKISGTPNLDWDLYTCTRAVSSTATPAPTQYFEFGGMWGTGGTLSAPYIRQVNPYTGANTCPTGFTQTQVLWTPNVDFTLFYCWKSLGTTVPTKDFGGMWGMFSTVPWVWWGTNYNNPVTSAASCPAGYTTKVAWGTDNKDWLFRWCYRETTVCPNAAQCSDTLDNDGDGKIDFIAPTTPTIPATYDFTVPFPGSTPDEPVPKVPTLPGRWQDIYNVMRGKFPASFPSPLTAGVVATMFYDDQPTADKICLMLGYQTAVKNRVYAYSNGQHKIVVWENGGWAEHPIGGAYNNAVLYWLTCSNPIATGGTILPDPDCTSATDNTEAPEVLPQCSDTIDNDGDGKIDFGGANADPDCTSLTDNTESGDLVCPVGTTKTPTPASPVCFLTATPTTSPAGTSFSLTGYSHLTGTCTLASATTHDVPPKTISPLVSLGLSVTPSISHISAVTESSFSLPTQVASLLTCPHGTATCSIGTNDVISCGCYNPGITPPGTTIPAASFPATYDFKTNFPGVNYAITPRSGDRAFSRDIVGVVNAHSPSLGLSDPSDTVSFYNTQATADQACSVLGYQTAEIYSDNKFDGTGGRKVAVYENNAWVIKPLSGNNDVINGLRCSDRTAGGTTTPSAVTPPTYTCESNTCDEGTYFCSAENICKPAGQPCSAITCNYDTKCDVGESCNCSDCTTGVLENDEDQCGLSWDGEQLYCTKDSVVASNITFPFCLPACLDGQACTTTCNVQVGACCPAGSQWNSTEDSCVPLTCGKGQFYCAAQKKCLPGGTTCDTTVCVNDGVCSGEESCQCADCVDWPTQTDPAKKADDKDKCSIIGGIQAMCSDDNLTDNKPGACCVPPEKWDSTANGGAGACRACTNTQAPAEIKANYDQPYITCTGNGVVADTHFRYRITKQGSTDAPFVSDIYQNSTQILHPKMSAGDYTVQCFYGNATTVNTTGTATPHTCEKRMQVKDANENAVQGCNRVYAYKRDQLSDELTSNTSFDASFRCGARMTTVDTVEPFALYIGSIAPQFLMADTFMTAFLAEFQIGAISTQTQNHTFNNGSTPVSCAVRVGGWYSTNDYCRATACVGDNCNVPQAFSVVHSGDAVCTTAQTDTYNIGCNPDAPDDIRTQCVEMFQSAVTAAGSGAANGTPFTLSFSFNGTQRSIECAKYAAGSPELHNIYDTVSCKALLDNGEYYDIYAADLNGNKINSLQTQTRTVQRDNDVPRLDPIKYYTDSSLTTEMTPGTWSSKPVTAVAVCRDTPTTESASCACAPLVDDSTTNKSEWTRGVYHGNVDIGADLLRYTRTISGNLIGAQSVVVIDTAGNKSTSQSLSVSIDTDAPVMTITESGTGSTRSVTLTATDSVSKIWKTTTAPATGSATNTQGIIWRKGLKANLSSLTFDAECGVTPSFATVSETGVASFPTTATVTIPAVNTADEVVTYCIRDNAGNTTRGIYPVVTDACFAATNMSPIPTFGNYKTLTNTRLGWSWTNNQKYGYSFSENSTTAACFRGILATNIQTFVANQLEPHTTKYALTNWDTDRAPTKANTSVLNTNGYYYYKYSWNTLNLTTSPSSIDTGTKSVIVDGGDIHIKENINYSGPGKTLLLIARRNVAGQWGNIIIDTTVTNIDAILIADGGALKSSNASAPGDRLTINGRIYSYNTRGGSLQPSGTELINATTPQIFSASGSLITAPSLADAQMQDLERFRPSFVGESTCSLYLNYYAYTTATLPLLLQKPVGYTGGNCGF